MKQAVDATGTAGGESDRGEQEGYYAIPERASEASAEERTAAYSCAAQQL